MVASDLKLVNHTKVTTGKTYTITVGSGGTGTNNNGSTYAPGVTSTQGGSSIFDSIIFCGQGAGNNGDGGSGSGARRAGRK